MFKKIWENVTKSLQALIKFDDGIFASAIVGINIYNWLQTRQCLISKRKS